MDCFFKILNFQQTSVFRKVCWLHSASEKQAPLNFPTVGYRRACDGRVCINDAAFGIWRQDFNPVTCNLLSITDKVSD